MPFDKDGIWTLPSEEDNADFQRQLLSKREEITPTSEMIEAIAANVPVEASPVHADNFEAIGRLKGEVDIVIPVYGGLHVLKPCVESIIAHTQWDYNLIFVDDCSPDPAVAVYLDELEKHVPDGFTVLTNKRNRGFAPTVNRGVAAGKAPYLCILNSDTVVTPGWLTRQLVALESDDRNVIVNPATNNTALVNVSMYSGTSYLDMAHAVSVSANATTYNEIMPTGFCFTLRRKTWDEIGPMDEAYISYGEETDFWFKALKQTDEDGVVLNNRAVIADNAYVYHERGASFSQLDAAEHMGLRRSGSERFNKLHPGFREWVKGHDSGGSVAHLRNDLPREAFKRDYKGNIAFVVKSAAPCGGMIFIADIVNQLIEDGYNAKVCVVMESFDEENPPPMPVVGHLRAAPVLFKSYEEFSTTFGQRVFTRGNVFAAVTEMTPIVWDIDQRLKGISGYNFVQSYDVALAKSVGREDMTDAINESYSRLPNIVASKWVADQLQDDGHNVQAVITPGINFDLYHPRDRELGDERFTVAILFSEHYQFKGKNWAEEFISALNPAKNPNLRLLAIGPQSCTHRGVTCLGGLSPARMADLLGTEVDVLVDPAEIHSYGLPALEALASGCRVVCRNNKGIHEYEDFWHGRVHVLEDPQDAADAVETLSYMECSREPLIGNKINRKLQIAKFIEFVYPPKQTGRRIEVITPHMRKHGGPTTIATTAQQIKLLGHNVNMAMIYTDWNPEVMQAARGMKMRAANITVPEEIELVVINSDNPFAEKIMESNTTAKYIMLKLSHNERFQAVEAGNLNLPWDHIITSTSWLKDACMNPKPNWEHTAWADNQVTIAGWYHYGHELFSMPPSNRTYGNAAVGFTMGTLMHPHPLKGTPQAMNVIDGLKRKYKDKFQAVGFGELRVGVPEHMQYFQSLNRANMANSFKQMDIWLGASHTEGLGRLSLEAMSAGCAVVTTDTGAEFLNDGENCLLYPVGKSQNGAECVDRLVQDAELFTKLVTNGYATAKAAADPAIYRQNLNTVIRKVLA